MSKVRIALAAAVFVSGPAAVFGQLDPWSMYGGDPQHTGLTTAPAQSMDQIRFQTPVDLDPQYTAGGDILVHYGSPLVTPLNTLLLPEKTGANGGFQIEAFNAFNPTAAANPTPMWTLTTDYVSPPHNWLPPFAPTITPQNELYFPGAGGTVYRATHFDDATAPVTQQISFYTHTAADDSSTFINTPLTSDSNGNVYYGVQVAGTNSAGALSCLVRVGANGATETFNVANNPNLPGCTNIVQNCAPAVSNDGSTIYVAVSNGNGSSFATGYLVALDASTLAFKAKVLLTDPATGSDAVLPDVGTSSPTIGPDGDVYFGVLENPFPSHNDRGWLLHFSADLSTAKTPGSFGWDDTVTVVPSSLVASYTGTSSYLLMTKYNNYAGINTGDGQNKVAVLDPNGTEADPVTPNTTVMKEVITQLGPTLDDEAGFPNAVREWCINNAAVDVTTKSIYVNSEDGSLYRWDLTTNTLAQSLKLTSGVGEAYTPTVVGPDGTVYAINNAVLFAAGSSATSQIDLTNQSVLLHNVSVSAATTRLHDGYNAGGSLWNGAGLISSTVRDTPGTAVGAISGADFLALNPGALFAGQTVASTDLLLKFTYAGDATFDGQITVADYAQIDTAFLLNLANPTWVNGDFNYDGVVDYRDYALIDAAYLIQSGELAAPMIDAHTTEFGEPYTLALEEDLAVPEPSSLGLAVAGGVGLLRVRRVPRVRRLV